MNTKQFDEQPLKVGFYKFQTGTFPLAYAEYKADLHPATEKTLVTINLMSLVTDGSNSPGQVHSLYLKLIHVTFVHYDEDSKVLKANWSIINLRQLEAMKKVAINKSNQRPAKVINTGCLSPEEALELYDKIKANPENKLPDDYEGQYNDDDINLPNSWPTDDNE